MLETLNILEIEGSAAGGYAAKLLADRGATVIIAVGHSHSAAWTEELRLYLNHSKTELSTADSADLAPLVADADIVIQSSSPEPLVSVLGPFTDDDRRIEVEISPFGSTGPWTGYRSTDLTDQAISGHLYLNGDPDREPLQGPDHQVAFAAGAHAAIGALSAVRARSITGRGQRVEVTHHEVMTSLHQFTLMRYTHNGDILTRMGNRYAGPGRPAGMYRCRDGLISLIAPRGDQVETLLAIAGLEHLLDRPEIESVYDLMHHPTILDHHLSLWLETQNRDETIELLQAVRVPAAAVSGMGDLLVDAHLRARRAWTTVTSDKGPPVRLPASPIRIAKTEAGSRSGPLPPTPSPPGHALADGPLTGLRVLDLTRVWAGPYCTRILADLGADVIMIEAPWARGQATIDRASVMATRYYPDNEPGERHWNRIGFFNQYGINKRNIALDLSKRDALAVLESLLEQADVLIENYSPRVMPQFGLDETRLHQINPSLVYVTMPGFGRTGPSRDHVAYGPIIDSQAGLSVLMGYEGETARKAGVAWPDPVAGMHAAFGTIAGVLERSADQAGRTVEVAQIESTIAMVGPAIIDHQLSGREPTPIGNRHHRFAPHGVYRSAGHDRWLAIAVIDQRSWRGLCHTAGFDRSWEPLAESERRDAHARIDEAIGKWTARGDNRDLAAELQAAGVPAAPVTDAAGVMADPHHHDRGFFVDLDHPEAGTHPWPGLAIRLSGTPPTYRRPSPNLNQHAGEILSGLVGLGPETIDALYASGAITDTPPG